MWIKQSTLVLFFFSLILVMAIGSWRSSPAIRAQDDPTPSTTIHIVQRGETLSQIAQLYSTTVDALMTNNGISDARFVQEGQPLQVPNVPKVQAATVGFVHTIETQSTIYIIAAQYAVPAERIINLNGITHPGRLYLGQALSLGEIGTRVRDYMPYRSQAGDTWERVAAQSGISVTELRALNPQFNTPLVAGLSIIVPTSDNPLPSPSSPAISYDVQPPQPIQGQSIRLQLNVANNTPVSGMFMGRPMDFAQLDDNTRVSIVAVHALAAPGVYSFDLMFSTSSGTSFPYEIRIGILNGDYGQEAIVIPPERSNLLEPRLVQSELDQVSAVMTGFTPTPYFNGTFSLPSAGPITSIYGTRRSYNGSPIDNNFHGGTDFGGAVGSPITAPADGIVVMAQGLDVRGNVVILDHGWGVYTGYWHLSEISVAVGQDIERGEILGLLGNTGLVTGAHLHWEMWVQDVQVDPMQWVEQAFR